MVAFQLNFGVKEWDDAIAAIATQDDRSTAIVTTSLLEDMIVTAIKSHFSQSDVKIEGEFMKGYGPLASFRSRIDLGFFMGIYSKDCHDRLLRIKNIRSRMAHKIEIQTFETQEIKDLLDFLPSANDLALCWENNPLAENDTGKIFQGVADELRGYPNNGKGRFLSYMQHRMMSTVTLKSTQNDKSRRYFMKHL